MLRASQYHRGLHHPGSPWQKRPTGNPHGFKAGLSEKRYPVCHLFRKIPPLLRHCKVCWGSLRRRECTTSGITVVGPILTPESIDCLSQAQTRVSYRSPRYLLSKIYSAYPAYRGFTSSNAAETQERSVYEQQHPRCSTHTVYCHAPNSQVFPFDCYSKVVVPT